MGKEGLTTKQVEHMKPHAERYEVPAGDPKGLFLVVQKTGSKSWALRYRWLGKPRKLTFRDGYPAMGLAAARAEAHAALALLNEGKDPAAAQAEVIAVEKPRQESVQTIVNEYVRRKVYVGEDKRSKHETERILNQAAHEWRHRAIRDVTKPDVLRLLDAIVDRGAPVMACRFRTTLMGFFDWARRERGYIERDPMADVGKPGPDNRNRDRVLEPDELAEILTAADSLGYPLGPFTRFLILTAQRRGEAACARWGHVDLDRAIWTLPAEATKPGRVHDVPLSRAAQELLRALPRFSEGDYIFTTTGGRFPINGFSKDKQRIDRLTLETRKSRGLEKNIDPWVVHDLRRSAATWMASIGTPPHILSSILNHSPGATQGVTRIYNRFRYFPERQAALEAWADFVDGLVAKEKPATEAARA
jgi:integrase